MAVTWAERQLQHFAEEAPKIEAHLASGAADDFFVERALNFLRSFLSIPPDNTPDGAPDSIGYTESLLAVAKMSRFLYMYIQPQGKWSEIIHLWPLLIAHLERAHQWELFAASALRLALVTSHQLGPQTAITYFRRLLDDPKFASLPALLRLEIWHQSSHCLVDLGDYAQAQFYLQSALLICQQNQDEPPRAVPLNSHGARIDIHGTFWEHHGFMLNMLGNIALMFGRYDQARGYYEQSARVFAPHDVNEDFAYSANQSLGRLWLYRQDYAKALPYLQRNYELCHRKTKVQGIAASSLYLAAAHIGLNQLDQGEELLNKAIGIFRQLQEPADIAHCHLYFGEMESKRGNQDAAVAQWNRAVELLHSNRAHMIKQQALSHLMLHHLRAGQIAHSLHAFASLLKSLQSQGIQPYDARFYPSSRPGAEKSKGN